MKTRPIAFLTLLLTSSLLAAPTSELAPAIELHTRAGLPNFFASLHANKEIRVAYFGGSITSAPGWRVMSLKWLQNRYPSAKLSEIHAAIGGTSSSLGVFRVGDHVIARKPDLVFVEFAVNDGSDTAEITRSMEGIVRQIWTANPSTDICFVYTLAANNAPTLAAGHYQFTATVHEKIAEHYNIPSIHFGVEVMKLQKEGKLVFTAKTPEERKAAADKIIFTNDSVHPTIPAGHELYQSVLARCLPEIERAASTPAPHTLPAPLDAANYEQAKLLDPAPSMLTGPWKQLDPKTDPLARSNAANFPALHQPLQPGAALTVRFKGTCIGLFDIRGPWSGQWRATIDNQPPLTINRFDGYCSYPRQSFFLLPILPPGDHTVRFELLPDPPDKAAILKAHKNGENFADLQAHPDKYKDSTVYVGKIMLTGQLLPD